MSVLAGKIIFDRVVRAGEPVPFYRLAAAFKVYTDQKLWEHWNYLSRNRPNIASDVYDLEFAMRKLEQTIDKLAFIESVVGHDGVSDWIDNGVRRAREVMDERQPKQIAPKGEAS